ncbi:hypothetical protein B1B_08247, partial [mine drainage metagenome]
AQLKESINLAETEEAELMQKNAPDIEMERSKGKLSMWRNILDSVASELSFEQITCAAVTAKGSTEFEAVGIAQQRAREIMAGISTSLGVSPITIVGNEILKFIEPEFQMPYSTMAEQITKSVEEQVI